MSIIKTIAAAVAGNMDRIATLGNWAPWIDRERSLLGRIPTDGTAPGFDAGIASCLGLIPEDKQGLSATLHTNYSLEAVEQVREEAVEMDADSETTWWLAACSICKESGVDEHGFLVQLDDFEVLVANPAARRMFEEMSQMFTVRDDGVAYGTQDGSAQGAYIAGYDLAVVWAESYGIYFISTMRPSLGLEDFEWGTETDDQDRPLSGPVHGNPAFVKAASAEEMERAVAVARGHLGIEA